MDREGVSNLSYLYVLCNYGISLNMVRKLIRDGYKIEDFYNVTDKVNNLEITKPAFVNEVLSILPKIAPDEVRDNLYQLVGEGLSERVVKSLQELGVTYNSLGNIDKKSFISMKEGHRETTFNKIKNAYEIVEAKKGRVPYSQFKQLANKYLFDMPFGRRIKKIELKEKLLNELPISEESLLIFLEKLEAEDSIIFDGCQYYLEHPKLESYLHPKSKDMEIFIERLKGKTLFILSEEFGYSRQGIRNIEKRVLKRMPEFEEDKKFLRLYTTYDIEKELFVKMFRVSPEVYEYLGLKYTKGTKSLLAHFEKEILSEEQITVLLNHSNMMVNTLGFPVEISKEAIFNEVLYKYSEESLDDMKVFDLYNAYINHKGIEKKYHISSVSTIRGIGDRSTNVIRGKGNTYRYYDYSNITDLDIEKLQSLIPENPGVYSMRKIFFENLELMGDFDIKTEYELHNLYRKMIDVLSVTYTRMPEFKVGDIDKYNFLMQSIKEQAPILINDFVEYMEMEYGLRKDSLNSYILSNFFEIIHENVLKIDYEEMQQADVNKLKLGMTEPIYTLAEVTSIGENLIGDFTNKFLNNKNLSKLGYTIRGKHILYNEYSSVEKYFTEYITSKEYFTMEKRDLYSTQNFLKVIYDLEKNNVIFRLDEKTFITEKKLRKVGIGIEVFEDFKTSLLNFIDDSFFSFQSLQKRGFSHELMELGFSDIFYEKLIWSIQEIKTIRVASCYIYKISENPISTSTFLKHIMDKYGVLSLEELVLELRNNYFLELQEHKIISSLKISGVFYSDELMKFYLDKEAYYEEVYGK